MPVRLLRVGLPFVLLLTVAETAFGLAEEKVGPDPKTHPQSDWAHGIVEVPRHPSRVYSLWVNGNDNFYFAAKPEEITDLITKFSKARMRDHIVKLVAGEPVVTSFKKQTFAYNVTLNLLGGIALWHTRTTSKEAYTHEPVLTIHVAGDDDRKLLEEYKWPDHIIIHNEVPDWKLRSKAQRPARKMMHAVVQFEDGKPATDYEVGMTTTITLWEKDHPHGFDLGRVSVKGEFGVALSLDEINRIKKGELWLTMTVGNFLAKPIPTHPKLKISDLAFTPEDANPVQVARSSQYFGRLLFEDGTPPIMKPEAWPGGKIHISFPYAGMARPDKDGYFKVTLTTKQLEELKARKRGKNIYVPRYGKQGRSTALHAFPADKLFRNKAQVVAVKIPKPVPPAAESE